MAQQPRHEVRDGRRTGVFLVENRIFDVGLPTHAIATYCCLCRHANRAGESWPSHATIAREIGAGRQTVIRALELLAARGLVRVESGRAEGASNTYVVQNVPEEPAAAAPPAPAAARAADALAGFADFWQAWPAHRRIERKRAEGQWRAQRLGSDEQAPLRARILEAIAAQRQGKAWNQGWIPSPFRWLRDERWGDAVEPAEALPGQLVPARAAEGQSRRLLANVTAAATWLQRIAPRARAQWEPVVLELVAAAEAHGRVLSAMQLNAYAEDLARYATEALVYAVRTARPRQYFPKVAELRALAIEYEERRRSSTPSLPPPAPDEAERAQVLELLRQTRARIQAAEVPGKAEAAQA